MPSDTARKAAADPSKHGKGRRGIRELKNLPAAAKALAGGVQTGSQLSGVKAQIPPAHSSHRRPT